MTGFVLYGWLIFLPRFFQDSLEGRRAPAASHCSDVARHSIRRDSVGTTAFEDRRALPSPGARHQSTHRSGDVFGLNHQRDDRDHPHRGLHRPHWDWPWGYAGRALGGDPEPGAVPAGGGWHVGEPVLADHGRHDGSRRNGGRNGSELPDRRRTAVGAAVPDSVKATLPEGLLDSLKEDPWGLLDPATADALRGNLAGAGSADSLVADRLLDSLNVALAGGLSNVLTLLAVAAALSFAGALCLRVRTGAETKATRREA